MPDGGKLDILLKAVIKELALAPGATEKLKKALEAALKDVKINVSPNIGTGGKSAAGGAGISDKEMRAAIKILVDSLKNFASESNKYADAVKVASEKVKKAAAAPGGRRPVSEAGGAEPAAPEFVEPRAGTAEKGRSKRKAKQTAKNMEDLLDQRSGIIQDGSAQALLAAHREFVDNATKVAEKRFGGLRASPRGISKELEKLVPIEGLEKETTEGLIKRLAPVREAIEKIAAAKEATGKGGIPGLENIEGTLKVFKSRAFAVRDFGGSEGKRLSRTARELMRGVLVKLQDRIVKAAQQAQDQLDAATKQDSGKSKEEIKKLTEARDNLLMQMERAFKLSTSELSIHKIKGRAGGPGYVTGAEKLLSPEELEGRSTLPKDVRKAQSFLRSTEIEDPFERVRKVLGLLSKDAAKFHDNLRTAVGAIDKMGANTEEERQKLKAVNAELKKQLSVMDRLKSTHKASLVIPAFSADAASPMKRFGQAIDSVRQQIAKAKDLQRGWTSEQKVSIQDASGAVRNLAVRYKKLGSTTGQVRVQIEELNKVMGSGQMLRTAFRRVALWGSAAGVTYGLVAAMRKAFQTMQDVELGVIELAKVMREADIDFRGFEKTVLSFSRAVAVEFGSSIKAALDVMAIFGRQGKSMVEVQELTKASLLAANVTVLNQTQAAEALTAAIHQFNLDANDSISIIDKWNQVANRNAVTEGVLAEAVKKAGSAASTVGISFDQFTGMVTAIGTATRQSGQQIGTSLRFIFQRSLRPETERTLAKYGVSVRNLSGGFRSFMDVLSEVAARWNEFSRSQQLAIAQAFGGARQYNAFLVLLRNYDLAVKAASDSIDAHGSAQRENARVMQSTQKHLAVLRAEVDRTVTQFGGALLPVIKSVVNAFALFTSGLNAIPNTLKGVAGAIAVVAVAMSRLQYTMAFAAPGAAGAGAGAGLGLLSGFAAGGGIRGLFGGAKTQQQIDSIKNIAGLGAQRQFKGLADAIELPVARFTELGVKQQAISRAFGAGTTNVSKFALALKRVPVGAEKSALALGSMNSILFSIALGGARIGQGILAGLSRAGVGLKAAFGGYKNMSAAHVDLIKKIKEHKALQAGLFASYGTLALSIGAVIGAYYLWTQVLFKAEKSGKQVKKDLGERLARREEEYSRITKQISALSDLERIQKRAETFRGGGSEEISSAVASRKYISPFLQDIRAAEAAVKTGDVFLLYSPGLVTGIDKFGNAILKTGTAMKDLSKAAKASQAALIGLTRIKIAKAFGRDAIKSVKSLRANLNLFRQVTKGVGLESQVFGNVEAFGEPFKKLSRRVIKHKNRIKVAIEEINRIMQALPRGTSIETFAAFLEEKPISKALSYEAARISSIWENVGKGAVTAAELVNRNFLRVASGLRGIGENARTTAELFAERLGVLPRTLEKIQKGGGKLTGGEILLLPKDLGLGFDQALLTVDDKGRKVVTALGKLKNPIKLALTDLFARGITPEQIKILDPKLVERAATASILQAKKIIAGAGAGLVEFPTKIDFGVKFKTDLGDVERLQRIMPKVVAAIYLAQQQYIKARADAEKRGKDTPTGAIETATRDILDQQRIMAGMFTEIAAFAGELEKIANSAEKAVISLRDANLSDAIDQEFSALYGAAAGALEGVNLPKIKTLKEVPTDEALSALSPGFTRLSRSITRAMEANKNIILSYSKLGSRDLDRMFGDFSAQFSKNFREYASSVGVSKGESLIATKLDVLVSLGRKLVEKFVGGLGLGNVGKALKELQLSDTAGIGRTVATGVLTAFRKGSPGFMGDFFKLLKDLSLQQRKAAVARGEVQVVEGLKLGKEALSPFYKIVSEIVKERAITGKVSRARAVEASEALLKILRAKLEELKAPPKTGQAISAQARVSQADIDRLSGLKLARRLSGFVKELETLPGTKRLVSSIISSIDNIFSSASGKKISGEVRDKLKDILSQVAERAKGEAKTRNALARANQERLNKERSLIMAAASATDGLFEFYRALKVGIRDLRESLKMKNILGALQAPLSGALRGITVPKVDLGKAAIDLSPVERLSVAFPSFSRGISDLSNLRTDMISLFQKVFTARGTIGERLQEARRTGVPQEALSRMQTLYDRATQFQNKFHQALERTNGIMSPIIESFRKMVVAEQARKGLEDIVRGLQKIAALEFDKTSIDMALGRHPLSRTPAQFGQPRGLDKFQRQLFEITQKMQRPLNRQQYQELELQKKKIEFSRDEALIQYEQSRETAKLRTEIQGAEKAMSVLFDAQVRGVSGVQPLIETLKSELSRAGETFTGYGGQEFFRGIPSLEGMAGELAKVQERIQVRSLEREKKIVMDPLLNIEAESKNILYDIKKIMEEQLAASAKALTPAGKKPEKPEDAVIALMDKFTKSTQTSLKSFVSEISILAKTSVYVRDSLKAAGDAAQMAAKRLERVIPKVSPPTGQSAKGMYSGGLVYGRSGVDNVATNLTAGEYVVPKSVVGTVGRGFFDNMIRHYQEGGTVKRLTPDEEDLIAAFLSKTALKGAFGKPSLGMFEDFNDYVALAAKSVWKGAKSPFVLAGNVYSGIKEHGVSGYARMVWRKYVEDWKQKNKAIEEGYLGPFGAPKYVETETLLGGKERVKNPYYKDITPESIISGTGEAVGSLLSFGGVSKLMGASLKAGKLLETKVFGATKEATTLGRSSTTIPLKKGVPRRAASTLETTKTPRGLAEKVAEDFSRGVPWAEADANFFFEKAREAISKARSAIIKKFPDSLVHKYKEKLTGAMKERYVADPRQGASFKQLKDLEDRVYATFSNATEGHFMSGSSVTYLENLKKSLKKLIPDVELARGGFVRGVGTGTSDSILSLLEPGSFVLREMAAKKLIPAMLSNGEYVVSPEEISKMGGKTVLEQMNKFGRIPRLQGGGAIELPGGLITSRGFQGTASSKSTEVDAKIISIAIEKAFETAASKYKVSLDIDATASDQIVNSVSAGVETGFKAAAEDVKSILKEGTSGMLGAGPGAATVQELERIKSSIEVLTTISNGVEKSISFINREIGDIKTEQSGTDLSNSDELKKINTIIEDIVEGQTSLGLKLDEQRRAHEQRFEAHGESINDLDSSVNKLKDDLLTRFNEQDTKLNTRISEIDVSGTVAKEVEKAVSTVEDSISGLKSVVNNAMTVAHMALSKTGDK